MGEAVGLPAEWGERATKSPPPAGAIENRLPRLVTRQQLTSYWLGRLLGKSLPGSGNWLLVPPENGVAPVGSWPP